MIDPRRVLGIVLAGLLMLGACSDDDGGDADAASAMTTSTVPVTTTTIPAPDETAVPEVAVTEGSKEEFCAAMETFNTALESTRQELVNSGLDEIAPGLLEGANGSIDPARADELGRGLVAALRSFAESLETPAEAAGLAASSAPAEIAGQAESMAQAYREGRDAMAEMITEYESVTDWPGRLNSSESVEGLFEPLSSLASGALAAESSIAVVAYTVENCEFEVSAAEPGVQAGGAATVDPAEVAPGLAEEFGLTEEQTRCFVDRLGDAPLPAYGHVGSDDVVDRIGAALVPCLAGFGPR